MTATVAPSTKALAKNMSRLEIQGCPRRLTLSTAALCPVGRDARAATGTAVPDVDDCPAARVAPQARVDAARIASRGRIGFPVSGTDEMRQVKQARRDKAAVTYRKSPVLFRTGQSPNFAARSR
jgi:hypothetical protein